MKSGPVRRKPPPNIPQETRLAVWDRAGAKCEWCGATQWGNRLQLAHLEHRKLGGRHGVMKQAIHDKRNIVLLCQACHDILDNRVRRPEVREKMWRELRIWTDWSSWAQEYGVRG